jgi:hypothetical protein
MATQPEVIGTKSASDSMGESRIWWWLEGKSHANVSII